MEKEKNNSSSLDIRLAKVREVTKEWQCCTLRYNDLAPYKKTGCEYMELSHEEVDAILPLFSKVFKQEIEVSRFNILSISDEKYFKFGIEDGEGLVDGKECRFKYLLVHNGGLPSIQVVCKDSSGKGIDHEFFPVFSVSCMPEESQEFISSVLDIVEYRLE
ncbi:MAG TPA: hypothetical protein PKI16_02830 [Candidatus Dojkabacteria bacterium]|nr:hypothetical protein [Candidatus Dojkabacteria bacterium]